MSILKNYQPTKGTCKVTFSYPISAAGACKNVQVIGDFNNWDSKQAPVMKLSKNEFTTTIELTAGQTYEFKYLLDGTKWDNDHSSDSYVSSPFAGINNSVLILDTVVTSKATPATKAPATKAPAKAKAASKAKSPAKAKATTKTVAKKAVAKKVVAKKAAPVVKVTPTVEAKKVTAQPVAKTATKVVAKVNTPAAPKAPATAKKATK